MTFGLEGIYVCPLCRLQFDFAALGRGQLTAEHVPPASRGGNRIILTCRTCNNASGHGVDAEAARSNEAARFEQVIRYGKPGKAGRLTLTWGNQPLTIDASVGDDGVTELKIVGSANDPARIKAAREFMTALSAAGKTDGYTMQGKSFVRFHPRKARIAVDDWRLEQFIRFEVGSLTTDGDLILQRAVPGTSRRDSLMAPSCKGTRHSHAGASVIPPAFQSYSCLASNNLHRYEYKHRHRLNVIAPFAKGTI